MLRSRKILVLSHCLLNANAKVFPLAACPGVCLQALSERMAAGEGLLQLPCPETAYLGMRRFGMTREQYDHPAYRRFCRVILTPSLDQMEAFAAAGYALTGVVGVDGSPSCGVNRTCTGFCGGEVGAAEADMAGQIAGLRRTPGRGVFMDVLHGLLQERGLQAPLLAVSEDDPTALLSGE